MIPQGNSSYTVITKINSHTTNTDHVTIFGGSGPNVGQYASYSNVLNNISGQAATSLRGAYSYRLASQTYYGPLFNIRNGSTSAQADFYSDNNGNLGTAIGASGTSISSWLNGATGYITIWYDQSGTNRHAIQNQSSLQPQLNLTGSTVNFVDFSIQTGSYFFLPAGTVPQQQPYTFIARHGTINNSAGGIIGSGVGNSCGNNVRVDGGQGYWNYWIFNDTGASSTYTAGNVVSVAYDGAGSPPNTSGTTTFYVNGVQTNQGYRSNWLGQSGYELLGKTTYDATLNGQLHDVFIFASCLSSYDRQLIETTIKPSLLSTPLSTQSLSLEYNLSTASYNAGWSSNIPLNGGTYSPGNVISTKYISGLGRSLYVNGTQVASDPLILYSFTTATFTTGGIRGQYGPTLAQAIAGVTGTPSPSTWTGTYFQMNSYQGIQQWTVPQSGTYTITCAGAGTDAWNGADGTTANAYGAVITGTFTLTVGQIVSIVCGQKPATGNPFNSSLGIGASGGSFIFIGTSLLIASGGATSAQNNGIPNNPPQVSSASLTTTGVSKSGAGGVGPNGGGGGAGYSGGSIGYGGISGVAGDGGPGPGSGSSSLMGGGGGGGGWSPTSAFLGGSYGSNVGSYSTYTASLSGGFGLGGGVGGYGTTNYAAACGGGGGYGGGGGGTAYSSGGGGGSYCAVTATSATLTNSGDGYVTITNMNPPTLVRTDSSFSYYIGAGYQSAGTLQYFNGELSSLYIFNVAMTDNDRILLEGFGTPYNVRDLGTLQTELGYSGSNPINFGSLRALSPLLANKPFSLNDIAGGPTYIGVLPSFPAANALQIIANTSNTADGTYFINVNNVPKATVCLLNPKWDGGGWMQIMKSYGTNTFEYNANYWTTANTLNTTDLVLHNASGTDSKYDVFNAVPVKDVLALWPTYDIGSGNTGGSLTVSEGWVWKVNNWYNLGGYITPLLGFQIDRPAPLTNAFDFDGISQSGSSIFSYMTGTYWHGFGSGKFWNGAQGWYQRWGMFWNNETNSLNTQDAITGIGMNANGFAYSAADRWYWGGVNHYGLNRAISCELYAR